METKNNIWNGGYTLASTGGEWDQPDALVNLTPHPLVIVGIDGPAGQGPEVSAAMVEALRLADAGQVMPLFPGHAVGALLVPSHGSVRLVESRPELRQIGGGMDTSPHDRTLSLWVPDCLAPETIFAVRYGEVTGDLPPDLGTEEYQGARDPVRGCESVLSDAVPYTSTRPAHYYTPGRNRVWFVVSLLTAMALRGRPDVVTTGPEVRTPEGRIVGCFGLRRVV